MMKNCLKAYTDIVLTRRWHHFENVIQSINKNHKNSAKSYKRHIEEIEKKLNKKRRVTEEDMRKLLMHKKFGRTTRILFYKLSRKNMDSRAFYSKIENLREHFVHQRVFKKILKSLEQFLKASPWAHWSSYLTHISNLKSDIIKMPNKKYIICQKCYSRQASILT